MKSFLLLLIFTTTLFSADIIEHYNSGKISLKENKVLLSGNKLGDFNIVQRFGDDKLILSQSKGGKSKVINKDGEVLNEYQLRGRYYSSSSSFHIFGKGAFGKIYFYDLDMNYLKTIEVNYTFDDVFCFDDDKIVIDASVPYSDKTKDVTIIKDLNTLKEKQLEPLFTGYRENTIYVKIGMQTVVLGTPFSRNNYIIEKLDQQHFIIGKSKDNSISVYNINGKEVDSIELSYETLTYTHSKKEEYIESVLNGRKVGDKIFYLHERAGITKDSLERKIRTEMVFPSKVPYFYNILTDEDKNLILFTYTLDKSTAMKVYIYNQKEGKFIDLQLEKNDYSLNMNTLVNSFSN